MVGAIIEVAGVLLLLLGTAFCVIGIYGVIRCDDIYNRLQSAAMVLTLGAIGIMLSLLLIGPLRAGLKGLATAVFLMLTGPLVTHVLARVAHRTGTRIAVRSARDDLATDRIRRDSS